MTQPQPQSQDAGERLINGVPADQWGTYCQHGVRVVAPDPTDRSDFPAGVVVEPWPCHAHGCTRESFDAAGEAEAEEYERARWDDYYAAITGRA